MKLYYAEVKKRQMQVICAHHFCLLKNLTVDDRLMPDRKHLSSPLKRCGVTCWRLAPRTAILRSNQYFPTFSSLHQSRMHYKIIADALSRPEKRKVGVHLMAVTYVDATGCRNEDNRSQENEAFLEAVKNCDDETYKEIISILTEAGLLPA